MKRGKKLILLLAVLAVLIAAVLAVVKLTPEDTGLSVFTRCFPPPMTI